MLDISIRSNIKQLEKDLNAFAYKQLPFATATALTALAKLVKPAEQANMQKVLDRPTPFTVNSVGVKGAKKNDLEATVFVKDIAAAYLEPYQFSGRNKLNSKALLKPVNQELNEYGNLPRTLLAQLKARSDIFIGPVKTKSGQIINGVWQREAESARVVGKKGKTRVTKKNLNASGHLKLIIRFEDAHPVKQNLDWFGVAQRVVSKNYNREMGKALAKAIASAR